MRVADLDTPILLVDLPRMERNIRRMADFAREAGVKLRPHVKTHKIPALADHQLAAGAAGVTVAKLGEAEVMADAGITDLLVCYPIVGHDKLERLAESPRHVVPGHDPLVLKRYPAPKAALEGVAVRLDVAPQD